MRHCLRRKFPRRLASNNEHLTKEIEELTAKEQIEKVLFMNESLGSQNSMILRKFNFHFEFEVPLI